MAKRNKYDFDLIVIGGGASGSVAADIVASNKWKVAVVTGNSDQNGIASTWGSIPMKALLKAAEIYNQAKVKGPELGLRSAAIGYNYPSIRTYKDKVMRKSGASSFESYATSKGITVLKGDARFIGRNEITVNKRHLSASHFLIATGSVPSDGKVQGLEETPYLTPQAALDLVRPPKSLFIIGAGATGCEFASLFSAFGTKVYLADEATRILPREDREVSELMTESFKKQRGMTVMTHTKVLRVAKDGIMRTVTCLTGSDERTIKVDQILLAAGQDPAVDIGLENAGVEYSKDGIKTDEFLATSRPYIFAAGDVLGRFPYTHSGVYEGKIVANNLIYPRQKLVPDYSAVPRVSFTSPEIASVGLSESDCLKRDLAIKKSVAPLSIIARATIDNESNGFVKIIASKQNEILGATIVAPHAGEMIHELVLAIQYGITTTEIANTLHAFPTWSEAIRVACTKIK